LPALQKECWGNSEPRVNWSRIQAANEFLEGKVLTDAVAAQATDLVLKDAKPVVHNGCKVLIAHALIRRALSKLKP
jgi:xanthine dehydrogenase YagS FAD-binding subunit